MAASSVVVVGAGRKPSEMNESLLAKSEFVVTTFAQAEMGIAEKAEAAAAAWGWRVADDLGWSMVY